MANPTDGPFIGIQIQNIPVCNLVEGGIHPEVCTTGNGTKASKCPFNDVCAMKDIGTPTITILPETATSLLRITFLDALSGCTMIIRRRANCTKDRSGVGNESVKFTQLNQTDAGQEEPSLPPIPEVPAEFELSEPPIDTDRYIKLQPHVLEHSINLRSILCMGCPLASACEQRNLNTPPLSALISRRKVAPLLIRRRITRSERDLNHAVIVDQATCYKDAAEQRIIINDYRYNHSYKPD